MFEISFSHTFENTSITSQPYSLGVHCGGETQTQDALRQHKKVDHVAVYDESYLVFGIT